MTSKQDRTTVPARKLHAYALEDPPGVDKTCPVCFDPFDYKIDPSDVDTVEFDGVFRGDVCFAGNGGVDYVFVHIAEVPERDDGFTEEDVAEWKANAVDGPGGKEPSTPDE